MKYRTQIKAFLKYYLMRMLGRRDTLRPSLWYPTEGWITEPNEVAGELAKAGFTERNTTCEICGEMNYHTPDCANNPVAEG